MPQRFGIKKNDPFFQSLLETMNEGMAVCSKELELIFVNTRLCHMLGLQREDLIGSHVSEHLSDSGKAEFFNRISQRFEGKSHRYEVEWQKKDGGVIPTIVSASPVYDSAGNINGAQALITDISQMRCAQNQVLERDRLLDQAARLASMGTISAEIAHELRTPLAAIIGFAKLIQYKPEDSNATAEYCQRIIQASEQMNNVVGHISSFSRYEDKEIPTENDMTQIVHKAMILITHKLKECEITFHFDPGEGFKVFAETHKLICVVQNLIVNSIDAFQSLAAKEAVNDEHRHQKIAIRFENLGSKYVFLYEDNAGGMSQESYEKAFDPYFTTKAKGKGTGLGLFIVSEIISKIGGSIRLENNPGIGLKYIIEFP